MRRLLSAIPVLPLCLALGSPAPAQDLDCANPTTQIEMTGCAARDWEAEDAALNAAYKRAMAKAKQMDAYLRPGEVPAATILRDAQRKWIPFRDEACEAESLIARGGSMQNMLYYLCLSKLTRQRTEDLRYFADVD